MKLLRAKDMIIGYQPTTPGDTETVPISESSSIHEHEVTSPEQAVASNGFQYWHLSTESSCLLRSSAGSD